MADQDVTIKVRQESEGTALDAAAQKMEALKARIAELNRLETTYAQKGITGTGDIAKERAGLQRQLGELEKSQTLQTRERASHEKAITREQREQEAVAKARDSKLMRVGRAGARLAENVAGSSEFGGVTSALGAVGGPAGMAAATVAAIAAAVGSAMLDQRLNLTMMGQRDTAARSVQGFQLSRLAGFEGSAGAARSEAMAAREDRVKREAERAEIEEKAKVRWWKPSTWLGGLTGSNQNAGRENEQGIQRDAEKEAAAKVVMRHKFAHEGAQEIAIQQSLAHGDVRRARAIEDSLAAYKELNRLKNEGATDGEAIAGAEAKVANIRRERAGQYSHFINSGTSAAAAARIATMAANAGAGGGGDDLTGELIGVVKEQHRDAMNLAGQKKFSDLQ